MYPMSDIHHNPEIYPDPLLYDPGRRTPEAKGITFVGFGTGAYKSDFALREQQGSPIIAFSYLGYRKTPLYRSSYGAYAN